MPSFVVFAPHGRLRSVLCHLPFDCVFLCEVFLVSLRLRFDLSYNEMLRFKCHFRFGALTQQRRFEVHPGRAAKIDQDDIPVTTTLCSFCWRRYAHLSSNHMLALLNGCAHFQSKDGVHFSILHLKNSIAIHSPPAGNHQTSTTRPCTKGKPY